MEFVVVHSPDQESTLKVSRYGATIVSWECQKREMLWMSSLSPLDGSAPIRGGVPIAFPQFADQGPLELHGFARQCFWEVSETGQTQDYSFIELTLSDKDLGNGSYPNDKLDSWSCTLFSLSYRILVSNSDLQLSFTVKNTGSAPFSFTHCLHSYLFTKDSSKLCLHTFPESTFTDKVDNMTIKPSEPLLYLEQAAAASAGGNSDAGYCDRIYQDAPRNMILEDESSAARIEFTSSCGYQDLVVYNPWKTGKLGAKGPDFDDEGYKHMICVEPALTRPLCLPPGEKFVATHRISYYSQQ